MSVSRTLFLLVVLSLFFLLGLGFEPPRFAVGQPQVVYQTLNRTTEVFVPAADFALQSVVVNGIGVYTNTTRGELIAINVSLKPGTGRTFIDVSDKAFSFGFEESVLTARNYAEDYTATSLKSRDLLLRLDSRAERLEGESGSAAISVAIIALVKNKTVKPFVVLTGIVDLDGRISAVDNLNTKIVVAGSLGVREVLVPNEQCDEVQAVQNVTVVCVSTVHEAVQQMFE